MQTRHPSTRTYWLKLALVAATGVAALVLPLAAEQQPADLLRSVSFREIGPTAQGGRYSDYAVVEATPRIFYAATASGGLWKTENHGITFTSIFDTQPVISIGAVALSQTNPNIVYVGTGEANNSRSSYSGDGIYKSTDAGATWTNVGLRNSQHVGRIVVHPTDPNTVYVASLGPLYSDNDERGVYKTTDGGTTWTKSLAVEVDGKHIGAVDVAMDPRNPNVLYAATYDKVRRPWTFAEGGPGSGIYKTTNAGRTWTRLAGGLPDGFLGRIGLSVARSAPATVYAIVEDAGPIDAAGRQRYAEGFGARSGSPAHLYRSDDAGATWRRVAPPVTPAPAAAGRGGRGGFDGGSPAYYYGQVRVDPSDPETVYVLSIGWIRSRDGGTTWERIPFGGDNHALWINPADSNHLIVGHDHGMGVSFDGGANWYDPDFLPLAQFYAISYDLAYPYNVYGGTQDNGSWKGPSTMPGGGPIRFEEWTRVGGGDGMYNVVDWKENRYLYNESQFGPIQRIDLVTGESKGIRYSRSQGQPPLRWNWNSPILVSPHNADVIYHGANVLLRSTFRGETWQEISPDLSENDPARQGGSGNIQYATITTIAESPIVAGLLYVGTDDGNVQVSRNGGQTWTNVRDRLPGHQGYWISRVDASRHDPAVAYASATGYRHDDFRPFVWKTTDFGDTWTSIAGNLPNEAINAIVEDPKNPNLLFAGTEPGLHVTLDGGRTWHDLQQDMPTTPVYDLQIHPRENELIVGTHGRGIFIADITGLQGLTAATLAADAALFDIQPAVRWVRPLPKASAALNFNGQSRPEGAIIHYYLRSATSDVRIQVYDGARVIADLDAPGLAGVNTVRWTLAASRAPVAGEAAGGGRGRGGRGGGGAGAAASLPAFPTTGVMSDAMPGAYRVVLSVGGRDYEKTAVVLADVWHERRR